MGEDEFVLGMRRSLGAACAGEQDDGAVGAQGIGGASLHVEPAQPTRDKYVSTHPTLPQRPASMCPSSSGSAVTPEDDAHPYMFIRVTTVPNDTTVGNSSSTKYTPRSYSTCTCTHATVIGLNLLLVRTPVPAFT